MLVSKAIKLNKIIMLQQLILNVYQSKRIKIPLRPDLFIDKEDIVNIQDPTQKLFYLHFAVNKNITISLDSFVNRELSTIEKMAIAIYARYFKANDTFNHLIEIYPEIMTSELWFE